MNLSFFEWMVLGGIYGGLLLIAACFQAIHRCLGEILDEMTGQAQRMRDEADFYDRGDRGKE